MSQNINIWALPTALKMLKDIKRELSEGVSLCIVATSPDSILEFQRALSYELEIREGLTICQIQLTELETVTLAGFQRSIIGESQSVSLDQFIKDEAPDAILIQGFEKITPSKQKEAISFMRRWADVCHTSGDTKSLCLIVPGDLADKINEIRSGTTSSRIKIRCLAGVPSALEIQLTSRASLDTDFSNAESYWNEILVSSLSGSDMDLAYLLGKSNLCTLEDIIRTLREYAELNSWERSKFEKELRGWMPLVNGAKIEVPLHSENIRLLWMQITVYTPEYGEEIHPAGLVLLGKDNEIKRRVWRAQTTLVFPVIDEMRIKIYSLLKDRILNTWEHQDIPEIGQIKYSLEQLPSDSLERKQYYEIIRHVRDVRNKLAHMDVISLHEYKTLWKFWQKIRMFTSE